MFFWNELTSLCEAPLYLCLVRVQPQPVLLHPLQYGPQAALEGQDGISCGRWEGDVELSIISVLMTQGSSPPDDPVQQLHIDVKQHWGDNRPLWNPTIGTPRGRDTLPKLYSLGTVLQEGTEPGQCKATDSQLREPPQEDTMVDSIKSFFLMGLMSVSLRARGTLPSWRDPLIIVWPIPLLQAWLL